MKVGVQKLEVGVWQFEVGQPAVLVKDSPSPRSARAREDQKEDEEQNLCSSVSICGPASPPWK